LFIDARNSRSTPLLPIQSLPVRWGRGDR
jgi:hypothetical protein